MIEEPINLTKHDRPVPKSTPTNFTIAKVTKMDLGRGETKYNIYVSTIDITGDIHFV